MKKARSSSSSSMTTTLGGPQASKVSVTFLSPLTPIPVNLFDDSWEMTLGPVVRNILGGDLTSVVGKRELLYREVDKLIKLNFTNCLKEEIDREFRDYCRSSILRPNSVEIIVQLFEKYLKSLDLIIKIFNALDRELRYISGVTRDVNQSSRDLLSMGYAAWRDVANDQSSQTLVGYSISEIESMRKTKSGHNIELVSKIMGLLQKIDVYFLIFEAQHILRSKNFISESAAQFLESNKSSSLVAYLHFVQTTFETERRLHTALNLPWSTWKIIDSEILRTELVLLRLPALIQADLANVVRTFDVPTLALLYNVSNWVNESIISESVLKFSFGESLATVFSEIITSGSFTDTSCIDRILQFRTNCQKILQDAFSNKPSFANCVKDAVESVINRPQFASVPSLLAAWMDEKLSAHLQEDESMNEASLWLPDVIGIFKLIGAKDIFEAHYRSFLAKRLIFISSNSAGLSSEISNLESNAVALLRAECGAGYTNKLDSMLKDIAAMSLEAENPIQDGLSFRVFVVTTGVWPNTLNVWTDRPSLPPRIHLAETEFIKKYSAANPKKSLKFVHSMTSAVVRYLRKDLVCSAAQALILNLFNETDSVDKRSILADTRLPDTELTRAITTLLDAGLLLCDTEIYSVNTHFKFTPGVQRVVLNQYQFRRCAGHLSITDEDRAQTESAVNEDRLHQLDASIVRTMKRVKKCSHAYLASEIMESTKFLFSKNEISKRVASLLDREFLDREPGDDGELRYLA